MTAIPNRLFVLLAEDDENDAILIRRAFKRLHPFAALTVIPDGEQAIAYLRGAGNFSNRVKWPVPDVLLLDQWMPRLTGLEVLSWLRAEPRFSSLPVAIFSGGLSPALADTAARLRAACCDKGVDVRQTPKSIDQAIRSALRLARECVLTADRGLATPALLTAPVADAECIRVWT